MHHLKLKSSSSLPLQPFWSHSPNYITFVYFALSFRFVSSSFLSDYCAPSAFLLSYLLSCLLSSQLLLNFHSRVALFTFFIFPSIFLFFFFPFSCFFFLLFIVSSLSRLARFPFVRFPFRLPALLFHFFLCVAALAQTESLFHFIIFFHFSLSFRSLASFISIIS